MTIKVVNSKFSELNTNELYDILKLRSEVFVVEQNCVYNDIDEVDKHPNVRHLMFKEDTTIVAYARLIPANVTYENVSIGRIVSSPSQRKRKLGHLIMTHALDICEQLWPNKSITLGAQYHLQKFYNKHGFMPSSEQYIEDGIPHIDMTLEKSFK